MKQDEGKRRSFLKHLLAGTAAVVGTAAIVRPAKAKPGKTIEVADNELYRETEDFKKYYKSLR
jgi:hypothetical protein